MRTKGDINSTNISQLTRKYSNVWLWRNLSKSCLIMVSSSIVKKWSKELDFTDLYYYSVCTFIEAFLNMYQFLIHQ